MLNKRCAPFSQQQYCRYAGLRKKHELPVRSAESLLQDWGTIAVNASSK